MHAIVTTPGFVIDSRSYGEADKIFSIFTEDLGLVRAVAQGIRLEKSKLRYHIKENVLASFSLVRGKEVWRLTNAQEVFAQDFLAQSSHKASEQLLARISLLLRRLLHGEEQNPALFMHIKNCIEFLNSQSLDDLSAPISETRLQTLESLVVARIFHSLGYINGGDVENCFKSAEISVSFLDSIASQRSALNKHVNKAIQESHL